METTTFEDYHNIRHVPSWVEKYCNLLSTNQNCQAKGLFEEAIRQMKMEEILVPNCSNYMVGQLTFQHNRLKFVLSIPVDYP